MKVTAKVDWKRVRGVIYAVIKDDGIRALIKWAIKKTAVGAGFKAWVIKELTEYLYEEIGEPVVKAILAKGGYTYAKIEGSVIVKKIKEAKDENNQADYDNGMDDLFN